MGEALAPAFVAAAVEDDRLKAVARGEVDHGLPEHVLGQVAVDDPHRREGLLRRDLAAAATDLGSDHGGRTDEGGQGEADCGCCGASSGVCVHTPTVGRWTR